MLKDKISIIQLCMIFTLVVGLTSHVIVNEAILNAAGRDGWISILATGVLFIVWCGLLIFIMRRSGQQQLLVWLKGRIGAVFAWLLIIPLLIQIYMIGGMTLSYTAMWTVANYLPATPMFVLSTSLLIVSYYSARSGLQTIAIGAGIVLPFVILLGIFVAGANIPHKDYNLLKPVLEYGMGRVYKGMIYVGSGFVEIIFILTMQHRLKTPFRYWQLVLLAIFLVFISIGPLIAAISEFGPTEAAKQTVSPYEQWRLVTIGSSLEHFDFFSIYQWLAGAYIRISLAIFLLVEMVNFRSIQYRHWFTLIISITYLLFSLIPISYESFFIFLNELYFPISLSVILIISIILGIIALFTKKIKGDTA